jgi:glycine cleavage system aminomethyltransferase T/glycine/D-amino acid oxidase-like deaminating enzyme
MDSALPREAKVVIVGGGVIGCSVAYHLTKFGWKDVVLLEQRKLAGGTTWHAAGLVGRLRASNSMTRINKYSAELYAGLEQETGHPTGWKQVGSLIAARSPERMKQLRRTAAMAERFGVDVHLISPGETREKWPLLRTDDLVGGAWLPDDGKIIPEQLTLALAKGATNRGATVLENVRVLDIEHADGRATGARTDRGNIRAEYVVLCGGMWSRQLALRCGVSLPLFPVEHHYAVTDPIPGAFDELPVGRDPDMCIYFRGEGNALVLGAFQAKSTPWTVDRVPDDFSFQLLEPDWERFAEPLQAGKWRIPVLEGATFAKFVNGPESFTPDNNFLLGETPEMRRLFVATGFNSLGIASAGGAGKYLAEWMAEGRPTMDLWSVDIRRFGPWANNRTFLRERSAEILGLHYQMAWPNREFATGRGLRQSPLYDRLAARGACFGSKAGWERPNWFASDGAKPVVEYSFGRQNWFDNHATEHRAARERVAVFDQTGFAKFRVHGRDAVRVLQRLCANNMDVPVGKTVYTALLNDRGGFESDLTAIRIATDEYYVVSGTAQAVRDRDWIGRNVEPNERMDVVDITEAFAVLGVMGPRARTLLARLTDADLSNEAFPFGTAQTIDLGRATVRAVRITYVGELGWELHIPTAQATLVYDALTEAGRDLGLTDAGHYAINSLRLEKGYAAWGAELTPDDTPLEAGLGFALAWDKSFLGREALLRQRAAGVKRRLVLFVLQDPAPVLWGGEPFYRDGRPVGYTTSGSYGHTVGGAVAQGYVADEGGVDEAFVRTGRYELEVSGQRYPAAAHLRAAYDPSRKRILT